MYKIPALALLLIICTTSAFAQAPLDAGSATGVLPYAPYGGARENISLTNGDLNLQIPLFRLAGRRGRDFDVKLTYDSKGYYLSHYVAACGPPLPITAMCDKYEWYGDPAGWRAGVPFLGTGGTLIIKAATSSSSEAECQQGGFSVIMGDGSQHAFGNLGECFNWADVTVSDAQDGTNMRLDTSSATDFILHLKDGTEIHFPPTGGIATKIEDPNGNIVTITPTTINGAVVVASMVDTVGRSTTFNYEVDPNNPGSELLSSVSYHDSNGASQTVTLGYSVVSYSPTFQLPAKAFAHSSGTLSSLSSILLPNGLSYSFQYNNYLELTKVTYPEGGYSRYDYGVFENGVTFAGMLIPGDVGEDFREVTARHVCRSSTGSCGSEDTTTYAPTASSSATSNTATSVTDPLGNLTKYQFSASGPQIPGEPTNDSPRELQRMVYQGSTTLLRTIQTAYDELDSNGNPRSWSLPISITTTLADSNQESQVQYDYDTYTMLFPTGYAISSQTIHLDNIVEKREYAYGAGAPGALVRRIDNTWLKTNSVNSQDYTATKVHILDRKITENTYAGSGTTAAAQVQHEYDNYTAGISASGAIQHDSTYTTSFTVRGNLTASMRWRNSDGTWLTTRYQYDDAGNTVQSTDPNGNTTKFSYADSWGNNACAPSSGNTAAYKTKTTNALNQVSQATYNSCTGTLASSTDTNSQTTSFTYDSMARLTSTKFPDGGQTVRSFNDPTVPSTMTTQRLIVGSTSVVTKDIYDGFGRISEHQLTSDPSGTVYTDTTYDALERVATVSNPYRSASDSTYGLTTYGYDALGRTNLVTMPDASTIATAYCGNATLVTDAAHKWRRSESDALGRLIEVDEPNSPTAAVNSTGCPGTSDPIWITTYTYDILNDLASVVQGGSRNRSFAFDSLKQMTSSTNPEAGTVTYSYDLDGNAHTKTDARSITTTYSYDALNRMTGETFSNGDSSVSYTYDQAACLGQSACHNVGRRTSMTDSAGSENMSYDSMGRELAEQRVTNSVTKSTSYSYNLDGSLATLTYPSGRVITYTYNAAEQPITATDVANSVDYAKSGVYAPQGALAQLGNGSNLVTTYIYNDRLQPCWIFATTGTPLPWQSTQTSCSSTATPAGNILDLKYNFNPGADNGDVIGITNNRDTTRTQTFSYDQLNRIVSAQTTATTGANCWGETYALDQWGNLTSIGAVSGYAGCTQENLSVSVASNNQLSVTGFSYDASGNMLNDGTNTYGWNAESEIKSAAGVNYTYDGDGNRLEKSNGKIYWYGAGSEILDESDLSGNFTNEYVFFGGKRIAMRNVATGSIYYYAEDFLGSSRTMVQAGQTSPCYDADFYPFGGERDINSSCAQNYKFEGKERDAETNNDDFGARYYSSRLGRWLSADWSAAPAPVPYANLTNPQTLNLYAMVSDNPESFADLDGHCVPLGLGSCGQAPEMPHQHNNDPFDGNGAQESEEGIEEENLIARYAQEEQKKKGIPAKETYSTRDQAAKAAEKAALAATNKSGRKWEYGGLILKNAQGEYTYTIAVTFNDQGHFYPGKVSIPDAFTSVADYHTHPESFKVEGQGLSVGDENFANRYNRTEYEADTYSRNMYRYTPGVSAYKPNEYCCGTIGDFVAHIPDQ